MPTTYRKNIAVILTRYQMDFFLKVRESESLSNVFVIVPEDIISSNYDCNFDISLLTYNFKYGYVSFLDARKRLSQIKKIIKSLRVSSDDVFWVANDENVIVQSMINLCKAKNIKYIEDGLGSYIRDDCLFCNKSVVSAIKKIKKIIYFFPYYRAFNGIGGNFKASHGYSYNESAYPMQFNIKRVLIEADFATRSCYNAAVNKSVIIVGQPLSEFGIVSKQEHARLLSQIINLFSNRRNILYIPHPAEINIKISSVRVVKLSSINIEEYIYNSGENLTICGFFSTALLNVSSFENIDNILAIRLSGDKTLSQVYEVLANNGVEVVDAGMLLT